MIIKDVVLAPGQGSFFYDDQAAIRKGVQQDGFIYLGQPETPGFGAIRVPAAALSIGLVLEDEFVAWGDMMGVQYSGAGGRDPLFDSSTASDLVSATLVPRLIGRDTECFVAACKNILASTASGRLPLAVEYGVSQALLAAAAHSRRITMAEVIVAEFKLPAPKQTIPLYCQSGDAREINVDKMILKHVDILPHGLINSREKVVKDGATFLEFVKWVAARVRHIGSGSYTPILHFDVYGWIGLAIGLEPRVVADFISRVTDAAPGFTVNIEAPADYGSTKAQVENFAAIAHLLDARESRARLVVDERCNTLDEIELFASSRAAHLVQIKTPDVGSLADAVRAVLVCKKHGVGAYVGGSCSETDISARATVHVSVATQADMMLAKPGMGVDEALSIVGNEQSRLFALLNRNLRSQV